MRYRVLLAEDAERDVEDLYRFIAARDGAETAERILTEIESACADLEKFPARGILQRNWPASVSPNTANCTISPGA